MNTAAAGAASLDTPEYLREISDADRLARALADVPELADWPRASLARMVPFLWERRIAAGQPLCRAGDAADHAFCVIDGSVRYSVSGREVSSGFVAHEAALDVPKYMADVVAATDALVLVVPRAVLHDFGIKLGGDTLYHSLLGRYTSLEDEHVSRVDEDEDEGRLSATKMIGWVLSLLVPAAIVALAGRYGLTWQQRDFLAALSACVLMMSFNLTPQYAAALIAGLACLLLDVAPVNVILSGFASDGFFMVMSIFGLGAVLTSSGLASRLVLYMLKVSPSSPFWYNLNILLTGIFLTPCLPSANTRVALMTPLVADTSRALGFRDGSREATRLMFSMFIGASLFAPMFLTAKSLNFVVYSQMPQQIRDEFQWLKWTMSASVAGLLMLGLYLVASAIIFRRGQRPRLSRTHLDAQLRLLGPMRAAEWTALIVAAAFMLAIVTYSLHKISPAWITLGVLCVFLVLGALNERDIRHNFQWDVLLLVGFFIGLEQTLDYTGITAMLTSNLGVVTDYMTTNFPLFIVLVAVVTGVLRLFLPITTAGVLVGSVFIPVAILNGINAWVVGFVIITISELWFLPAQCSYYLTLDELSGEKPVHDRALFLRLNALSMAIRIAALFASLPFFRYLGLL